MPQVVLKGPMRRYYLRGRLFERGVVPKKPVSQELRDECIATGRFEDVGGPAVVAPVPRSGAVKVFGAKAKAEAAREAEASKDTGGGPPFSGKGAKVAAETYARKTFGVELDRRNTVGTLNDKLSQLEDGVTPDKIQGVKVLSDEDKEKYGFTGAGMVPV